MGSKPSQVSSTTLEGLLKGLVAAHAKMGEQIAAFEATLLAANTPGMAAKKWLGDYGSAWSARYGGQRFIIDNWPAAMASAKRLLGELSHDELLTRAIAFLADRDAFYVNARHPLGLFAKNVNRYSSAPATEREEEFLVAPPVGCRHRPACRSDVEHTKKTRDEMRTL